MCMCIDLTFITGYMHQEGAAVVTITKGQEYLRQQDYITHLIQIIQIDPHGLFLRHPFPDSFTSSPPR